MRTGQQRQWLVGSLIIGIIVFILVLMEYLLNWTWNWTGILNKTLWDWLQLLIIPLVLTVVAFLFNQANSRNERKITSQRFQQDRELRMINKGKKYFRLTSIECQSCFSMAN